MLGCVSMSGSLIVKDWQNPCSQLGGEGWGLCSGAGGVQDAKTKPQAWAQTKSNGDVEVAGEDFFTK